MRPHTTDRTRAAPGRGPDPGSEGDADSVGWLADFVARCGAVAGSIHRVDGDRLSLVASWRIPDSVRERTRSIPKGKGMAGLAWERGVPVQTCNLQTDTSGDVRPGARAVNARAAIAIPLRDVSGVIAGVVGVAFPDERELDAATIEHLSDAASQWRNRGEDAGS